MEISIRFRAFLLICSLIISLSLFLFNDLMTIWSGAEASWLWASLSLEKTSFLPLAAMKILAQTQENFPFIPRVTGAVLFLASVLGFYHIAKPYLGKMVVLLTALVLGAGFLIPVLSKLATLDIWIFSFHFLTFFTMIRYLKQPDVIWRGLFYLGLSFSILIQPVSALVFLMGSAAFLWWKHPQGRRLVTLNPWIAGLLLTVVFHYLGLLHWQNEWLIFSTGGADFGKYMLFNFIGILPFVGFWVGGLRDLVYKLKKGEEMALMLASLILFSILAQSPVLQAGFALMITKQMLLFSDEQYPFKNWVRATTMIHLLFAFVLSVLLMLGGMTEFGGLGFRSGLIFSFMYWAVGLIGIFGLYGTQRTMLIGGPVASGVLSMFIFWMQLYPLVESQRNLPKRLIEKVEVLENAPFFEKIFIAVPKEGRPSNLAVYAKLAFPAAGIIELDGNEAGNEWKKTPKSILFRPVGQSETPSEGIIILKGWNDQLKKVTWSVQPE